MKKLLIIALALVLIGAVVWAASAAAMGFDFQKMDSGTYETNTYTVKDADFQNISIEASVEKIAFRPAGDGKCSVVCYEGAHWKHCVEVSDGTLTVKALDNRKLSDRFLFNLKAPEITVYLPERAYSELFIETDTGDIEIPAEFSFERIAVKGDTSDVTCLADAKDGVDIDVTTGDITLTSIEAGAVDLRVTTGKISAQSVKIAGDLVIRVDTGKTLLRDVTCRGLVSEGTTGDITLSNFVAADTLRITRDTGDVEFDGSDAESIFVKTSTGDVTGSLRSEKVFLTESHTGKVEVPKSISGGRCEISTDTGNIKLEVR